MSTVRLFSIVIIFVLTAMQSVAQRYPFHNLGVEDGLIQSQVMDIVQDDYGHLWMSTLGGVSRYDGGSFTNYSVRDGMLSNNTNAIATDKEGNIWIGGEKGISVFDGNNFKHYTFGPVENNTNNQTAKGFIKSDNKIWCYTDSNVYTIIGDKINRISLPDSHSTITSILPDGKTLWVATITGQIYKRQGSRWDTLFYNFPGFYHAPIYTTQIYKTAGNEQLLVTRSGLFKIENDTIITYTVNGNTITNVPLLSIAEGKDSSLWLGSSGVYEIRNGKIKHYNKQNGFTDNAITGILHDKEGNVWFGSDGQGLFRYSGSQFSIIDESSNLPGEQVVSMAVTNNDRLYFGTYDEGLFTYQNNEVSHIPLNYKNLFVTSLAVKNNYDIWMGTRGLGLWNLRGGQRFSYNTPNIPSSVITALYYDDNSRLWIGTSNGTAIYSDKRFQTLNNKGAVVSAFVRIGRDSILMATNNKGLQLYHDSTLSPFKTGSATDSSPAQCLAMQGNTLWVGTNDNGVIAYNLSTGKSIVINKSNGLQSDFVYNLIADNNGDVWAGTGYGIHRIKLKNGKPKVSFYGKAQGVSGMESNQNAVAKTSDGTLWFGTTKGVVHIDPETELLHAQPVSIIMQSVKLFGNDIRDTNYYDSADKWYHVPYNLELPYKKNNITFTFRAISLTGTDQILYRYKIDGLNSPWSDWSTINSVTYSALPSGKYSFEVEARSVNSDTAQTLSYPFSIETPIHKTGWFSFVILGLCILAGIGIQYVINMRKKNREDLVEMLRKEEQAKVRQRTAEDFHDEVGNKLTRINVLTNVLKQKVSKLAPDSVRIIDQIHDNTGQLYSGTRDILWSLQPSNDNLYEILNRVRDFGTELFEDTGIHFEFSKSDRVWHSYKLPLDMSRNFLMICKEALNNALKYSEAENVRVEVTIKEMDIMYLMIYDDGKSFNVEEVVSGNGLNNMRNRAKRLGGKLYIDSNAGEGTSINLHFQLPGKYKDK